MAPIVAIFGHAVQSYHLCAAAAGLVGFLLAVLALRGEGVWRFLLPLLTTAAALIGARLLNVLTNPEAYHDFSPFSLSYTKLSLMGGLILGVAVLLLFAAVKKRPTGQVLDAFVLPAAAEIVLLKTGCFLNGCCFGKPTEGPFGMIFPANQKKYDFINSLSILKATSPVVHPTQLYELCGAVLAAVLALTLGRRLKPGGKFWLFAMGFSLTRLIVLPLRVLPYDRAVTAVFYPCLYGAILLLGALRLIFSNRKAR